MQRHAVHRVLALGAATAGLALLGACTGHVAPAARQPVHGGGRAAAVPNPTPAMTCQSGESDAAASADNVARCFYVAWRTHDAATAKNYSRDPETYENSISSYAVMNADAPATAGRARFAGCSSVTAIPGWPTEAAGTPGNPMRCEFTHGSHRVDVYPAEISSAEPGAGSMRVFAVGFDGQDVPPTP